ncbi:MAG TPA: phosphatase PAP2 family protein [Bacteroidota bacterium]
MSELLRSIDLGLFVFINQSLQNAVLDFLMPFITDLNKQLPVLITVLAILAWMVVKGGTTGRIAAVLLIITITFSDQLSSSWVKHLFERVRPCHELENVHLLVDCGSGYSFPSSHAVNSFAGATVLSFFFRKWLWAFASFAVVAALSRIYVGVHYPSDVAGGALLGFACGALIVYLFILAKSWWIARTKKTPEMPND